MSADALIEWRGASYHAVGRRRGRVAARHACTAAHASNRGPPAEKEPAIRLWTGI